MYIGNSKLGVVSQESAGQVYDQQGQKLGIVSIEDPRKYKGLSIGELRILMMVTTSSFWMENEIPVLRKNCDLARIKERSKEYIGILSFLIASIRGMNFELSEAIV